MKISEAFGSKFSSPEQLINTLLPNIIGLAAIIMFLLMIGAGFSMIAGAGNEASAQDKAKAKAAFTYSLIGFLLVVSSYFILQIISTVLGIDFISPKSLL